MKHFLCLLSLAAVSILALDSTCLAQGLAERRAIKEYQDGKFKQLETDIRSTVGFEVPVTVDWNKLALPGYAEHYKEDEFWTNIYFMPLIGALKDVAKDDMGKQALKEKLKEISITFDDATAPASNYRNGLQFDAGKLSINFKPWSNAQDVALRQKAIQTTLEEKL